VLILIIGDQILDDSQCLKNTTDFYVDL